MRDIVYHGKLNFKGYNFTYLLENFLLTLYPEEKDKNTISNNIFYDEINKGTYALKNKVYVEKSYLIATVDGSDKLLIMFFQEKTKISRSNIFRLHDIVLYVPCVAYALVIDDIKIDKLLISCEELNYIYPVSNFIKVNKTDKEDMINGVLSLETLDFVSSTSKPSSFVFNNSVIKSFFTVGRYISFENPKPLSLDSYLNFEITNGLDYEHLINVFLIADNFLQFLCYRKNINYSSIKLLSKDKDERYEQIGHLVVNVSNREKENDYIIKNRFIPFKSIAGIEERIFKDIVNKRLYTRHYPSSHKNNTISYSTRFVLITSAFEWEYKQCYKNVKKKKSISREKAEMDVANKLDELSKDIKYTKKARKLFGKLKNDIVRVSLAEKIVNVKSDYSNLVEYFGNKIYQMNEEKFDIDRISKRLSKQRNDYAHGNLDEKVEELAFLDLYFIEVVVYILQMNRYRNTEERSKVAIEKLFNLR